MSGVYLSIVLIACLLRNKPLGCHGCLFHVAPRKQSQKRVASKLLQPLVFRNHWFLLKCPRNLVDGWLATPINNKFKRELANQLHITAPNFHFQLATCFLYNFYSNKKRSKLSKLLNFEEVSYDTPGVRHSPWKKMFGKIPSFWYVTFQGATAIFWAVSMSILFFLATLF